MDKEEFLNEIMVCVPRNGGYTLMLSNPQLSDYIKLALWKEHITAINMEDQDAIDNNLLAVRTLKSKIEKRNEDLK